MLTNRRYGPKYLASLVLISLLSLFAYLLQGPSGAAAVVSIFIILPVISWYFLRTLKPAEKLLRFFLDSNETPDVRYHFDRSAQPTVNIEWRAFQLTLSVLGVSAFVTQKITSVTLESGPALVVFITLVVVVLSISSLVLIPIWVYDDSGLRRHHVRRVTVTVPMDRARGWLMFGGIGAYLSFASTLSGGLLGGLIFTATLFFFLGPLCYLLTAIFHDKMEKDAVEGVWKVGESHNVQVRSTGIQ